MFPEISSATSHTRRPPPVSVMVMSTCVRSHEWLPCLGPMASWITSPARTDTVLAANSDEPFTPKSPCPRLPTLRLFRCCTHHSTPLPQLCASAILADTDTIPSIGLRQPTATYCVGDGCATTACGRAVPGMRTSVSDELAATDGVPKVPQPFTKS